MTWRTLTACVVIAKPVLATVRSPSFKVTISKRWNGEWSQTRQGDSGDTYQLKGYWSAIKVRKGDAWKDRCRPGT